MTSVRRSNEDFAARLPEYLEEIESWFTWYMHYFKIVLPIKRHNESLQNFTTIQTKEQRINYW